MNALKCLIVDDEPLAIDVVATFLGRLDIKDITRCGNAVEALQVLQRDKFDLMFLDIEMPQVNGIDLLRNLPQKPAVVITTAYREHAVEGFELDVLDYLVKPFSFPRFVQTMEKVSIAATVARAGGASLFLKADRQMIRVLISDICFIESRKDYIRVNTLHGQWLCHQSLSEITAKLPGDKFFRLHRSFTVGLDKISLYRNNCVHVNGREIPVSRENRQELRRRLTV